MPMAKGYGILRFLQVEGHLKSDTCSDADANWLKTKEQQRADSSETVTQGKVYKGMGTWLLPACLASI